MQRSAIGHQEHGNRGTIIITITVITRSSEIFAAIESFSAERQPARRARSRCSGGSARRNPRFTASPIDKIHLHEVGALDSIIDIVGAVFAIEWFKADRIVVSPINVGSGMVRTEHGVFPVPAPATVSLLKNAPVYSSGIQIGAADADRRADPHASSRRRLGRFRR